MSAETITAGGVVIAAAITGVLTLIGVIRSVRAQKAKTATDRDLGLIDDYREWTKEVREQAAADKKELTDRIDQQDHAITDLRRRLNLVEARERVLLDYAHRLRAHIDRELGPPAPDWPDILTT